MPSHSNNSLFCTAKRLRAVLVAAVALGLLLWNPDFGGDPLAAVAPEGRQAQAQQDQDAPYRSKLPLPRSLRPRIAPDTAKIPKLPPVMAAPREDLDPGADKVAQKPFRPPLPKARPAKGRRGKPDKDDDKRSKKEEKKKKKKSGGDSGESECEPRDSREEIAIDLKEDTDIKELIEMMAEMRCETYLLTDRVKNAKVNLIGPAVMTVGEAYKLFLATLDSKGMTIVDAGRFKKIIGSRDSISQPIPTLLRGEPVPRRDQMITMLYRMKHIDANEIQNTIKQLVSKDAVIIPYAATNSLIINEIGTNIHRLMKIMRTLDVPAGQAELWVIQIKYATAQEIADKLQQIFDAGQGGGKKKTTSSRSRTASRSKSKSKSKSKSTADASDAAVEIEKVLVDERTNRLIIMAPEKSIGRIRSLIEWLDVPIPGEGSLHVHYLRNAKAEELASTISGLAQSGRRSGGRAGGGGDGGDGLFEGDVQISADKATNSLIIIASESDYDSLKRVIERLDIQRPQVFVEAVIMEVTLTKTRDVGISFHGAYEGPDIAGEEAFSFGASTNALNSLLLNPQSASSLLGFLGGVQGPAVDVTLGGQTLSLPGFGAVFNLLQDNSAVDVLSTPHILTTDNEEANIVVGQNVPFQSGFTQGIGGGVGGGIGGFNPIVSVQRQDVALTLKVTPQISGGNYVRLSVDQEVSEIASISQTLGPTTTKRSAKTTVVVKDQHTVVIGGLMRERAAETETKVPFLGDIPLLGWLFRSKRVEKEKTNLLIFLTPSIITDPSDFRRIFERKMRERRVFADKFYGGDIIEHHVSLDYRRKSGPLSVVDRTLTKESEAIKTGRTKDGDLIIDPNKRKEDARDIKRFKSDDEKKGESGEGAAPEDPVFVDPEGNLAPGLGMDAEPNPAEGEIIRPTGDSEGSAPAPTEGELPPSDAAPAPAPADPAPADPAPADPAPADPAPAEPAPAPAENKEKLDVEP